MPLPSDEVHVGDEEANSQVLHIVVVGRSLLPQRFNLSLELPRSVTEIALDKPLKVVLPKGRSKRLMRLCLS